MTDEIDSLPAAPSLSDVEHLFEEARLLGDRQWRLRIVTILLPLVIALLLFSISYFYFQTARASTFGHETLTFRFLRRTTTWMVVLGGISILAAMMMYLQTGFRRRVEHESAFRMLRERERRHVEQAMPVYSDETFTAAERAPRDVGATTIVADEDASPAPENLVRPGAEVAGDKYTTPAMSVSRASHILGRMNAEVARLGWRGNLNLVLGIAITSIGIGALFYFVTTQVPGKKDEMPWIFLEHFLPRVSLVILVEVFAYFFLRLYKESLDDIKYFQTEITRVEMKTLALTVATELKDSEATRMLLTRFAERDAIPSPPQQVREASKTSVVAGETDPLIILRDVAKIIEAATGKK